MNFCVAILVLKMKENMQHFWHVMLYYFKKGKNTTDTQKEIYAVYREGAVAEWTCQRLSAKFVLEISHWTMMFHSWVDQLKLIIIKKLIENNKHYIMQEIANIFKISKSTKVLVKLESVLFIYGKK